ncbi:hypothetical protein KEM56_005665 [Ascosphaera pollenicola]|nr:hypothetical protein KEM56_005665 [Ascosphaera pollenicola]
MYGVLLGRVRVAEVLASDKKQFKGDDLTIILALIFYFAEICFWACCGLTKLSMILLYQRIFQDHFRRLGYFCIAVTLFWLHLTVLASVFQCDPIKAVWDLDLLGAPNVRCLNRQVLSDALAIVNTVMHCMLFVLPIFPLRRLKLPERQTMMLCITFGICALAGGFSLYRTVCVLRHQMRQGDATWTGECQAMCDALEANITIICPCLPMVPSLINHNFPNNRLFRGLKSCEAQAVPEPRGRGRERDVEARVGAGNAAAATSEVHDAHGGNEFLGTYSVAVIIPKRDTEERENAEEEEETCASATACASDQGTLGTSEAGTSATQISQSASSYSYCSRSWTTITGSFGTEYEGEPRPDTSRYENALERRPSVRYALDPVEPTLAQPRI